ncbi:hypothetical protein EV182_003986 [Spiromyces aspiralis]|uniref:Uncharacterized protein n=1 Tax=Spiromyces aspiralis TaxID=68401 RepID=A0ACC1HBY1_9FUNG|nr:hypothetical protein EV182_003986 [Spiromyces aspiralis]
MSSISQSRQDYFDIDDILAQSQASDLTHLELCATQRVPCIFNIDVDGVGGSGDMQDSMIRRNTRLALPFWIADKFNEEYVPTGAISPVMAAAAIRPRLVAASNNSLCWLCREIVDMEAPKAFGKRAKRMFSASAVHLDMHSLSPYFYRLGNHIAEM